MVDGAGCCALLCRCLPVSAFQRHCRHLSHAARAAGSGPLSLEAALVGQGGAAAQREPPPPPIVPAPTDVAAAEADPLAALEEAIAADKPK